MAAQAGEGGDDVGGGDRREQMGHVAPQFGRDPTEAERDQPADGWIAADGDQHLGDDVGHRRLDQVAGLGRRHDRRRGLHGGAVAQPDTYRPGLALVGQPECLQRDRVADRVGRVADTVEVDDATLWHGDADGSQMRLGGGLVDDSRRRRCQHSGVHRPDIAAHGAGCAERHQSLAQAEQRRQTARGHVVAERFVDALGQRGHDHCSSPCSLGRIGQCIGSGVPRRRVVVGSRRRIEHQHRGVLRAVHDGGEARRHRRRGRPT